MPTPDRVAGLQALPSSFRRREVPGIIALAQKPRSQHRETRHNQIAEQKTRLLRSLLTRSESRRRNLNRPVSLRHRVTPHRILQLRFEGPRRIGRGEWAGGGGGGG